MLFVILSFSYVITEKLNKMKKEKFWESRRVWGAGLTLVATALIIAFPENVIIIAPIMTGLAGLLGLGSWTFPKK